MSEEASASINVAQPEKANARALAGIGYALLVVAEAIRALAVREEGEADDR